MSLNARMALRLRPVVNQLARARPAARAFVSTKKPTPPPPIEPSDAQSMPLGAYYESILNTPQPIPDEKTEEPPQSSIPKRQEKDKEEPADKEDGAPSPPPASKKPGKTKPGRKPKDQAASSPAAAGPARPLPTPPPITAAEKAAIVFGSRLAGPAERAERLAEVRARSTLVAGVLVPPRPEEPDNCCMSGCVNCVWDRYREEVETWSAASAEARARLAEQHGEEKAAQVTAQQKQQQQKQMAGAEGASIEDDGGGSERHWDVGPAKITKDLWDDELYRDLPVGIREFMRQEKRLKERHAREGTTGG